MTDKVIWTAQGLQLRERGGVYPLQDGNRLVRTLSREDLARLRTCLQHELRPALPGPLEVPAIGPSQVKDSESTFDAGRGRCPAGSHKPGLAGSTPAPATRTKGAKRGT